MLLLADLNIEEFYTLYGKDKIENAVLYTKDLKDDIRFFVTVLCINYDLFADEKI